MAKAGAGAGAGAAAEGQRLLTLTQVSKQIGLSMPTLQKYKKRYADRIPSVGKGRTQRYPQESLPVFEELRKENLGRRGRPRKSAAAGEGAEARRRGRRSRKGRARGGAPARQGLLTLTQVAEQTGISYPTLLRYVKTHLGKLPHAGSGRARRFKPEAVEAFRRLRAQSRAGRPPGSGARKRGGRKAAAPAAAGARRRGRPPGAAGAGAGVQAVLQRLEKRLARVEAELKKPLRVEVRR
jgi:excisionase family DNA binding protein